MSFVVNNLREGGVHKGQKSQNLVGCDVGVQTGTTPSPRSALPLFS